MLSAYHDGMWLLEMPLYFAGLPSLIVDMSNISRKFPSKKMHVHSRSHKMDCPVLNYRFPAAKIRDHIKKLRDGFAYGGVYRYQAFRQRDEVDLRGVGFPCAQFNQRGRKKNQIRTQSAQHLITWLCRPKMLVCQIKYLSFFKQRLIPGMRFGQHANWLFHIQDVFVNDINLITGRPQHQIAGFYG